MRLHQSAPDASKDRRTPLGSGRWNANITLLALSLRGHCLVADGLLLPATCMEKGRGGTDPIMGAPPHDQ